MSMNKLFVIDTDSNFQAQVKSLCPTNQVKVQFYSSSMKSLSLIGKEKPGLIFVNIEVPDLDDFVMHDLLKKTSGQSIPVLLTYSAQSEKDLRKYTKMKFQVKGSYKKPIPDKELYGLLKSNLELEEEEDEDEVDVDEFTDASIDRLVKGELPGIVIKDKDETKENLEREAIQKEIEKKTKVEESEINDPFLVDLANIPDMFQETVPVARKGNKTGREPKTQETGTSPGRINEPFRDDNRDLTGIVESLKKEIARRNEEFYQLKSDMNEKTGEQQNMVDQLRNIISKLQDEVGHIREKNENEKEGLLQQADSIKNYSQELEDQNRELIQKLKESDKEKSGLQLQVKELTGQLTNKEKELTARRDELEQQLHHRYDEMVKDLEGRLVSEFKQKEHQLDQKIGQLKEEKENIQVSLHNEIESLKKSIRELQGKNDELSKREESLARTISALSEEKVTLSQGLAALEKNLIQREKELEEKSREHLQGAGKINEEIEDLRNKLSFYKNREKELVEMLKQALTLAQEQS